MYTMMNRFLLLLIFPLLIKINYHKLSFPECPLPKPVYTPFYFGFIAVKSSSTA